MDRVERKYYADGTLQEEVHYRGTKEHGQWRRWHPNGVLAEEYWFEDGLYTDSVLRTWYSSGALRTEATMVNGGLIGRQTLYNEDGSVQLRWYSLEDGEVSRAKYDEACRHQPKLPRYVDDDPTPGPPCRRSTRRPNVGTVDPHNADFVAKLLASEKAEALAWLRGGSRDCARNLGEMSADSSIEFVERLYQLGAVEVLAVEIAVSPFDQDQSSNHLLVALPEGAAARECLFAFENEHAEGLGFDGEADRGQKYLYLMLC